jgi:hypothetical protein
MIILLKSIHFSSYYFLYPRPSPEIFLERFVTRNAPGSVTFNYKPQDRLPENGLQSKVAAPGMEFFSNVTQFLHRCKRSETLRGMVGRWKGKVDTGCFL